jgi:signal peptidase II
MWLGLGIAGLVIVLDQFSKYAVLHWLLSGIVVQPMFAGFNMVRAWNTGVSFSMLNNYGHLGAWLLSALAVVIVLMLYHWLKREDNRLTQAALGMIMGGALGNVIDRVRFGAVFDFLDFYVGNIHWPAFNAADSFICIGAAIILTQAIVAKVKRG